MTFHHERRLDRALYHLDSLKAEVRAWAGERPYRIWSDFDVNPLYKLVWLEVLEPPPIDLSPIVGDCIHNLRAALDNLVLELAFAYKRGRASKSIEVDSGFPIFSTRSDENMKKLKKMLRGINPRAKTIIERLQPYNRRARGYADATIRLCSNPSSMAATPSETYWVAEAWRRCTSLTTRC